MRKIAKALWGRLHQKDYGIVAEHFDATFYLSRNEDVRRAGIDPLQHYLQHGWREGRHPVPWFDIIEYQKRHPDLLDKDIEPFEHYLNSDAFQNLGRKEPTSNATDAAAVKSSMVNGAAKTNTPIKGLPTQENMRLVAQFFDSKFYLETYPEVAKIDIDPLVHFLTIGCSQGYDPAEDFSVSYYLENNEDLVGMHMNPFVHFCKHGRYEKWRARAGVKEAKILKAFNQSTSLCNAIEEAKVLEPMVALPDVPRTVVIPSRVQAKLAQAARKVRLAAKGREYEHVVLVPHIRMSGAARVASVFTDVLQKSKKSGSVLVVTTDSSENENKRWFSDDIDFIDLAEIVSDLPESERIRLLVDLLRGVGASAIYNVNSRLSWRALEVYGRQISQELKVFTYLFTWDETVRGARVGYPIQWLRNTCDYHDVLITDSTFLLNDIAERYGFKAGDRSTDVVALHTPVDIDANPVRVSKNEKAARPVFLWAGRFDRQKRPDILLDIISANPDFDFHVFGKPVLDKNHPLNPDKVPNNCILKGTYTSLDDVLNDVHYSGFVYTAQWDGIPTILLDIAARELPIIAPTVGGVPELIDSKTGYPIRQFDDVGSYSAALKDVVNDSQKASRRASAAKKRLATDFAQERYETLLTEVLRRHDL